MAFAVVTSVTNKSTK